MKFAVGLPIDQLQHGQEFLGKTALTEVAQAAEAAGFDACSVTDHPCPSGRWLDAGGHFAQDPFAMLGMVSMVTTRIKLLTALVVVPYRNPFIAARSVASLDAFSGGRFIFGVGAGYLKAEFKALGVDFETRNERTDEALRAMKVAWTQDEFTVEGTDFSARGMRILPRPLQQPHPPIWIGGNSKRAVRRAADLGDGWMPFNAAPQLAEAAHTAVLEGTEGLAERLAYLREYEKQIGRTKPVEVIANLPRDFTGSEKSVAGTREVVAGFAELGASWIALNIKAETRAEWCARARQFGAEIIAKKA